MILSQHPLTVGTLDKQSPQIHSKLLQHSNTVTNQTEGQLDARGLLAVQGTYIKCK